MKDIRITDRQERIEGFRQKVIDEAAVCVIGTGRTGNEVLKNMALAGFRRVLIADMDTVAKTNLPATVLFTKDDLGRLKVDAAAEAYRRLSIADSCAVDRINADVCTGLGEGAVRRCDLIINCVDNDQTRLYTAHLGKLLGIPCIDVGIRDLDWTIFAASGDKDEACYGCTMTQNAWDKALERVRNSCDVTLRDNIAQGKASTIITSGAFAGAAAVEEAIKMLHHRIDPENRLFDPRCGVMTIYSSVSRKLESYRIRVKDHCRNHFCYADFGGVVPTDLSADDRLGDVLARVEREYGKGWQLSLEKDCIPVSNKAFVTKGFCKSCGRPIDIYRPQFTLSDGDLLCEECRAKGALPAFPSGAERVWNFSLDGTEQRILDMSLAEIGIPRFHVIELDDMKEDRPPLFLELTGDEEKVLPCLTEYRKKTAGKEETHADV